MPFLVLWPLEGAYSVLNEKQIVSPKKTYDDYSIGDDLTALYQSKKYPAKIVQKSENRQELQTEMMKIVSEANVNIAFKRNMGRDSNLESETSTDSSEAPSPKKKKLTERVQESECNSVENEAKSAKATESKKKKDTAQLRENMSKKVGQEMFSTCACPNEDIVGIKAHLERIEKKKTDADTKPSCPVPTSPRPESKASISILPTDTKSDQVVSQCEDEKMTTTTTSEEEKEGLTFLGDVKYSVKMSKETLERCRKTAKTPEKLALNVIEHLLTAEETKNITMYGNNQHNKKPLDENKRRALRSEIASTFPAFDWEKVVGALNDKIRKMRKQEGHDGPESLT